MSLSLDDLAREIQREPSSYVQEYILELKHLKSLLLLLLQSPNSFSKNDFSCVNFIQSTCIYYKAVTTREMEKVIIEVLEKINFRNEIYEVFMVILKLFMKFGEVKIIKSQKFYFEALFKLLKIPHKNVSKTIQKRIIKELVNNANSNQHTDKQFKNLLFSFTKDSHKIISKCAYHILGKIYKKNIWVDDKRIVNVMAESIFRRETKTMVCGLCFFLNEYFEDELDDIFMKKNEEKSIVNDIKSLIITHGNSHSKKTKKKKNVFKRKLKRLKTRQRKLQEQKNMDNVTSYNTNNSYMNINIKIFEDLHNPSKFAQKCFAKLRSSNDRFEVKTMLMRVIARCIAINEIQMPNFYPFMQQHVEPGYENVTKILAIIAESIHINVPTEVLIPLIKNIANKFLNDKSSPLNLSIGLNTIRLICEKNSLAMTRSLLNDVTIYGVHKIGTVSTAARGIINLYKTHNPNLLNKKIKVKKIKQEVNEDDSIDGILTFDGVEGLDLLNTSEGINIDDTIDFIDQEQFEKIDEMKVILGKRSREEYESADGFLFLNEDDEDEDDNEDDIIDNRNVNYHLKSSTNRRKRKSKNYMMVKNSRNVRNKEKRSARERVQLRNKTIKRQRKWKNKKRKKDF